MLQAGKMEEIADELEKYNIQITALQEVRWSQDGCVKKKNCTPLQSGLKTSKGSTWYRNPYYGLCNTKYIRLGIR